MMAENLFCKCVLLPIRYFRSTRRLCTSITRRLPRKKTQEEKQLLPTSITEFSKLFDCPYHRAYKILHEHKTLRDFTVDRLQKSIHFCGKMGIDKEDILENPDVLVIHPITIEQHTMLLQEGGFTDVDARTLINYIPVIKKRISLLKAYGYIPPETDVPQHFLSYLEPEAQAIRIPRVLTDSETSFVDANLLALRHYLMWRLGADPKQLDVMFKTYARLRHKSFRMIKRALDILESELGFTKERIMKNAFLIHAHPDNINGILNTINNVGGVPIRDMIRKHPKICMTPVETISGTLGHFENFGISNEAIRKCPEVLTLGSSSVYERLLYLKVVPEFSAFLTHPRILRLVHYQKKARSRLEYLQQLRMKCVSLHILSTAGSKFEKFAKEGADKTKGTDLSFFLSQELGYSEQSLRASLVRHPFWCHVPLVAVRETLQFLFLKGFTKQQINSSVHILLYPVSRVKQELEKLASYPELSKENLIPLTPEWRYNPVKIPTETSVSVSPCSDGESSSDEDVRAVPYKPDYLWTSSRGELQNSSVSDWIASVSPSSVFVPSRSRRDLRLDFCIYFIEKEHHFTGDGIWTHTQPQLIEKHSEDLSHPSLPRVPT